MGTMGQENGEGKCRSGNGRRQEQYKKIQERSHVNENETVGK